MINYVHVPTLLSRDLRIMVAMTALEETYVDPSRFRVVILVAMVLVIGRLLADGGI